MVRKLTASKITVGMVSVAVLAGIVYFFKPLQGSMREFNADTVAKRETVMWRYYYEKRYPALLWTLYRTIRDQYQLSPYHSVLIAKDMAFAAKEFQVSRNREQAEKVIPRLEKAYSLLARVTNEHFDAKRAARLELEWWQQRRELVPPEEYVKTMLDLVCTIYGHENDPRMYAAVKGRIAMMVFRDAHRHTGMSHDDWNYVYHGLRESGQYLQDAICTQ